jgi:hypothetical protein
MPRFVVRLEDPDSEEFRETSLLADDKAAAKAWCETREHRSVAFQVPDDELAELEKLRAADAKRKPDEPPQLRGREKARLHTHEQRKPYKVVSVKELG